MQVSKNVLITGSNRGIGKVISETFAKAGYNIIAHTRKDTEEFTGFLNCLEEKYGVKTFKALFDLADSESMKSAISDLRNRNVYADVLVNSAGIAGGNLLVMTSMREVRKVFDVNLFACMELTQLVVKHMIKNKKGVIVNVSSIEGIDLYPGNSAYGVSKAALLAWTKTMAMELGGLGIRVNAVAPGFVDTGMSEQTEYKARESIINSGSMRRMAHPVEIADVVLFLASEKASFINGEIIRIDGGMI